MSDASGVGGIRTRRLSLHPVAEDDLAGLHAHWTEPAVRRYLWDGRVIARDEVREIIATSDRLFRELDAGLWAVRPPDAPTLIGCAGFWYFHEPPELEFVLSLTPAWWGTGLALECASALLQHALVRLEWPFVQASADAPNEASGRLMRRLGMQPAGERPGEFGAIDVFRITREAWEARPG